MKRWIVYGLGLLMATTAVAGMKVRSLSVPGVDLGNYATYAWHSNHDSDSGSFMAEGSPTAKRMEGLGNPLLAERGLSEVSSGEPDLWIRYTALSVGNVKMAKNRGEGGDVNWILEPMTFHDVSYRQGTLLLEFVDAESERLVWAGWASDVVPDADQLIVQKIDKAIQKILKKLPKS
jgi:hypothetical protein